MGLCNNYSRGDQTRETQWIDSGQAKIFFLDNRAEVWVYVRNRMTINAE
jgi:hypothetical protein